MLAERGVDLRREPARGPAGEAQQLRLATCRSEGPMRGFADDGGIVAVCHNQTGFARQVALFLEYPRQMRGHRPIKTVAITEIVEPFAITEQVRLGDLDLDDGAAPLAIDRH